MAQKKRRNQGQARQRTWTFSRVLLIIGYGMVIVFLGTLFLMRQELRRVGIFGDKSSPPSSVPPAVSPSQPLTDPQRPTLTPPPATTGSQSSAPVSPPRVTTEIQPSPTSPPASTASSPARSGEFTVEEKQALEDILRSKR
jgi:hypothetical protein